MAFFRAPNFAESFPIVEGEGVFLRSPQMSDYPEWAALREASRAFLTPWEPTWPPDDLTRSAFRRRLRRYAEDQRTDQAYSFLLFRSDEVVDARRQRHRHAQYQNREDAQRDGDFDHRETFLADGHNGLASSHQSPDPASVGRSVGRTVRDPR